MGPFVYYAIHTFVNQIRKLFKSWVLIFLVVCMAMGMLIGIGAAMLEDASGVPDEPVADSEVLEDGPSLEETLGIAPLELVELAAGGIILGIFVMNAVFADKNGSKIFLPADVALLFPAPIRPQTILLFRSLAQMGAVLLAGIYLLFQLPNMVMQFGGGVWEALAVLATWCLTLMAGTLLQILLYTVCSTYLRLKRHLRTAIYVFLALVAGAYVLYWKTGGQDALTAAVAFFNAPASRWIPLWGWLKGITLFALEGEPLFALLSLGLVLVSGVGLCWVIWHLEPDFYEEAMAKSEETAELMARVQSEKATVVVQRKKDRSEKIRRDGLRHGAGANVYFFRSLYIRSRFAKLGYFTKTSVTYLVAAVGVAAFCRFVFQTDALLPVVLTLGGFAFFRALGDPLERDVQMEHFLLIPEPTWKKLFWSLMGGTADCLLDLLPAVVVSAILSGSDLLMALACIPLIVSVDFYSATVGSFIGITTPTSAGTTVKQLVQILFIYFGLLPDIAILAVGLVFGHPVMAIAACTAANILLGLLFFLLTSLVLDPKAVTEEERVL